MDGYMISIAADGLWVLTRCANKMNPWSMDRERGLGPSHVSCSSDHDETLVYIHRIILYPVSCIQLSISKVHLEARHLAVSSLNCSWGDGGTVWKGIDTCMYDYHRMEKGESCQWEGIHVDRKYRCIVRHKPKGSMHCQINLITIICNNKGSKLILCPSGFNVPILVRT